MSWAVDTTPALVRPLLTVLKPQPQPVPGTVLAAMLRAPMEEVFAALVWMEARGAAVLRPVDGSESRRFGWAVGVTELGRGIH